MAVKLPHNYLFGVRHDVSLAFAIRDLGQGMLPRKSLRTGRLTTKSAGAPSRNKASFTRRTLVRPATDLFTLV